MIVVVEWLAGNKCFRLNTRSVSVAGKPKYKNNLCSHWAVTVELVTVMMCSNVNCKMTETVCLFFMNCGLKLYHLLKVLNVLRK